MSELKDEVFSNDFPQYRKKEIEVAAMFVSTLINLRESSDYVKGAMDMFRKILNIPANLARTDEQKEFIRRRIDEDFARFSVEYLRKVLKEEY